MRYKPYTYHQSNTFKYLKNMNVSHLNRMEPKKILFIYKYTISSSNNNEHTENELSSSEFLPMRKFLIDNYDQYCKTIVKAIKASYKEQK